MFPVFAGWDAGQQRAPHPVAWELTDAIGDGRPGGLVGFDGLDQLVLADPARDRLVCARSGTTAIEVSPLPVTPSEPLDCIALPLPVDPGDWRLRHKTTDRGFYADALAAARDLDAHEALLVRDDGLVTEGSWTSVFVERDGTLVTPPRAHGLLPGVFRESLIAEGRAVEGEVILDDLSGGFWIGNAVHTYLSWPKKGKPKDTASVGIGFNRDMQQVQLQLKIPLGD